MECVPVTYPLANIVPVMVVLVVTEPLVALRFTFAGGVAVQLIVPGPPVLEIVILNVGLIPLP